MICTLIKNDYILIEPFLLISLSQREDEAETRGYRMGQGPTAGHSQPEPHPAHGGEHTLEEGATPLNFKDVLPHPHPAGGAL